MLVFVFHFKRTLCVWIDETQIGAQTPQGSNSQISLMKSRCASKCHCFGASNNLDIGASQCSMCLFFVHVLHIFGSEPLLAWMCVCANFSYFQIQK